MKCLFCKQGETRPGRVTVVLQRGETLVIFKEVPGDVCENCGEYFLSGEVTGQLLGLVTKQVSHLRRSEDRHWSEP